MVMGSGEKLEKEKEKEEGKGKKKFRFRFWFQSYEIISVRQSHSKCLILTRSAIKNQRNYLQCLKWSDLKSWSYTVEYRSNGPARNGNPPITEAILKSLEKFSL